MSTNHSFYLPENLSAKEPIEMRGRMRDEARLMVIDRATGAVTHSQFRSIGQYLRQGDLLIFNASRTLPVVLAAREATTGEPVEIRLAEHLPDGTWLGLLLCLAGEPFACALEAGMTLLIGEDFKAEVIARDKAIPRLWQLRFNKSGTELTDILFKIGKPVRYEYVSKPWALESYQTVYATEPGSAEMPSAGRAFTWRVLFDLKKRGIKIGTIVLHTGLSSYMDDELDKQHPASEEEYLISTKTAEQIRKTKMAGGRVIAVGTTVVRALESAAVENGVVEARHAYTRLHISPDSILHVCDGLLTGLHEPEASHLDLLSAFLPFETIKPAYEEAVRLGYLWHEFGDLNLIV